MEDAKVGLIRDAKVNPTAANGGKRWGTPETNKREVVTRSLAWIMSEQLVAKEQETEERVATPALTDDLEALCQQGILTRDEALAIMKSDEATGEGRAENETKATSVPLSNDLQQLVDQGVISVDEAKNMMLEDSDENVVNVTPNTKDDENLAKAIQLEEQLKGQEAHEQAAKESNRRMGSSKLRFATDLAAPTGLERQADEDYVDEWYEDGEDETKFVASDINKHSAKVSGRRNMKRLEKNTMSSNLGQLSEDTTLANSVYNSINEFMKKQAKANGRGFGGRNAVEMRKTKNGAFDARTRRGILKLINRGALDFVSNVIRQGKEACVCSAYGAGMPTEPGSVQTKDEGGATVREKKYLAVKLYFTTLSDFQNRSDYVEGDPRYHSSNFSNQKYTAALKIWAEKEFRNYKRMEKAGICCPKAYSVIDSMLVMSLIHTNGRAAKQLKEVREWTPKKLRRYYIKVIALIKNLYQNCKLVHADLSEYNLLVSKHELYVIDVGQAVDVKHPKALQYLRRDIKIISNFFEKALKKANLSIGQLSEDAVYELVTGLGEGQEEEEEEEGEVDQEEDGCTTDTTQTISIDSAITVQTFDDLLVKKMETNLLS